MNSALSSKILVVDDRPENLIAMRHILAKIDSEIVCANSGSSALKQLLREEFAVVLLDVQMPNMNGFETAELIRCNEETQYVPIIFITAISKEERYVRQGYELGAVDYLFKPVEPNMLRSKVDVFTDLYRQRNKYLALAKKHQLILDSVKEGVLGVDSGGKIVFANPAVNNLLKVSWQDLEGQCITNFIQDYRGCSWEKSEIFRLCSAGQDYSRQDLKFIPADAEPFPAEFTASAMIDKKNKLEGFVIAFEDISDRIKAEQQLAHLAEYDPLTGLANRRYFYRLLPKLLAKSKRLKHEIALMYLDIDHFKIINDTLGHVTGDLMLNQFAKRLKSCVRETDTVVRLGGDEFTIVLEGQLNQDSTGKLATSIISQLAEPFELNGNVINCTVSIGIAFSSKQTNDINELIKSADIAMYSAKEKGRNNYQFFTDALDKKMSFRSKVESHLQQAMDQNEFFLVYQPKMCFRLNKLLGFESLLRWNSQELGKISPATFIPIAEDSGRIEDVGSWVLRQALRQLKEWSDKGLIEKEFRLSVNFSVRQLNNPYFLQKLEKILNQINIDPCHLDIEITETTLMANPNSIVPLLKLLSLMGMSISVDDFGTGYSSLSYLKVLPIHYLKIDQSFVKDIFRDTNSEIITRSIINLAHNLDLKVTAEGVETKEQHDFLEYYGCDLGQGFYYGRPEIAEFFEKKPFFDGSDRAMTNTTKHG